jgi:hypothetical protein
LDQEKRRGTSRLTITLPASVMDALERRALEEGRSMSNLAAYLLELYARDCGRKE